MSKCWVEQDDKRLGEFARSWLEHNPDSKGRIRRTIPATVWSDFGRSLDRSGSACRKRYYKLIEASKQSLTTVANNDVGVTIGDTPMTLQESVGTILRSVECLLDETNSESTATSRRVGAIDLLGVAQHLLRTWDK